MTGIISTLEKVEHAHNPNMFRPICILSAFYRVWASIRTKQVVEFLSDLCPAGLHGNRKGHDSSKLWWNLAAEIEASILDGVPLSGTLGDLVKCYNTLPRIPVFHIASHLLLPPEILTPWFSAISQVERRFSILGEVGRPLKSTTGFPEGDPLSIVSMMLINIAMDTFMNISHPQTRLLTYVDNIEIVGRDVDNIILAVSSLQTFCDHLDVQLDQPKQLYWSTSAKERKQLRDEQIKVTYQVRDLGSQLTYCRRHANSVIRKRCQSMHEHWHRMARSPAPYTRKITSLISAAWPKALHGISIAMLGNVHISQLRTGAMRGLCCTNKGIAPMLHLSFVHGGCTDPGYYALWQTIIAYRRHADPSLAWPILDHLATSSKTRPDPGPCSVLLQRLHAI